ncbi:serine hydrolase domain-containing protein [Coleofasciculus sp. FACHB-T130]|uniref:serine hydrolase domain-containing protein n=1 Tax=Cyanophyceae TaxID=3028117 RepID=UPI001688A56B|nr:serine hydrolase domain-containing protein [Coleofasciculus sp. FACHB-T130]MBD1877719.1 beta-lactamase family protein [Coleofasciculus sp. FACHB-T130]
MLNFYQLEQQIEEQMKASAIPGLALSVVQNGEVIYARGFGVTSVEDGSIPVTPQTLFRIGSVTKPLTGTAVMRLVETGKLDLDRPIKDYIDWFALSEEGAAERITLRMLMTHTSGLPTDAQNFGRRDPEGLEAYVRDQIPKYPIIAPPGKLYSYSNPGIMVVGYLAEVVSGKPFTQLMQELVFDPLEMQRTTFDPTVAMTYPIAQSHNQNEDGTLSVDRRFADNTAGYPAGFVISTVLDLANFAMMHMNQGCFRDRQILSPQSVAQMQTLHADWYTAEGAGYGLTFMVDPYKGIRRIGHNGAISSFGSWFLMVPEADVAVSLVFNRRAPDFAAYKIVNRIFDELLNLPKQAPKPQAIAPDTALWSQYTGLYLGPQTGLLKIQVVDGQLMLELNEQVMPLQALKKDLYFAQKPDSQDKIPVGFILEATEPTRYIMVNSSPCERIELDASFVPDFSAWASYAGSYMSYLDTLTIHVEADRVFLHTKMFNQDVPCILIDNTHFACKFGLIEVQVAEDGVARSLNLGNYFIFPRC